MMREGMGGMDSETMSERMREMMKGGTPLREVPFYQEKTFLVIITGLAVFILSWMMKRRAMRPWRASRERSSVSQEAILVVDLCESTKLAVTQADVFAMRIKNKMKACVREVAERFGANSFENIGDGYLITFPAAASAAKAAVKILRNADDYNREASEKERIKLRIGINYGELIFDEQGGRHGAAINKAFRIEGLKKEDQRIMAGGSKPEEFLEKNRIFISEELKEEIRDGKEIPVQHVGVFDLKGFTGLHRIYAIRWKDIPPD
jgi:class 3 adenylate cyclase